MTDSNSNSDGRVMTILPSDFSNELFEQNMAYLSDNQPALFKAIKKHKCKEYWICSNSDGSPNIAHLPSKSPVYFASTMDELMAPIIQQIDQLSCFTYLDVAFFNEGSVWWKNNNPIQMRMQNKLYEAGVFHEMQLSSNMVTPLRGYCTDYLPLVRVYGIGLGYHLTELIQRKKISFMTVYEPNFDLFYTSLFTIPWNLIFKYFAYNNKGINLVLDATPDKAIESNLIFIESRLTPLTSLFYRFNHFESLPVMQDIIKKEPISDSTHRAAFDAGWYEDQRAGFYHCARNIKDRNKFYTGKKVKRFLRIFVVGSGPSLDESIGYIKAHRDDAVIISCGSATAPLLESGVVPDYQVVMERTWHMAKDEEALDLSLLKNISLLKLNVISPKVDPYYKETFIFQKYRDPGSSLLQGSYPETTDVNPTVTNAGIAFAAEFGANEVYLFGVDYGAPKGSERMHASNTLYDDSDVDDSVELEARYDVPGNLGADIRTTSVLSWSLEVAKHRIASHQNIQWLNVGEGAMIAGVSPIAVEDLPVKFNKKIQKHKLREEISRCFDNNYSPDEVFNRLNTYHMEQVKGYFEALLAFTSSTPQSREEIISTLSLMYKAASIGVGEVDFLPSSLISNGIKQYINNVYIQVGLAKDAESAVRFFEVAKAIFTEHVNDIEEDLKAILNYIEAEEETEIYKGEWAW